MGSTASTQRSSTHTGEKQPNQCSSDSALGRVLGKNSPRTYPIEKGVAENAALTTLVRKWIFFMGPSISRQKDSERPSLLRGKQSIALGKVRLEGMAPSSPEKR